MPRCCLNSCGREAKDGLDFCCMKCKLSDGQDHGPCCEALAVALAEGRRPQNLVWQVRLSSDWTRLTNKRENDHAIVEAEASGRDYAMIYERGFPYRIDFVSMRQINQYSGKALCIRLAEWVDDWKPVVVPPRHPRLQAIVNCLVSSTVQVPAAPEMPEKQVARLTQEEVDQMIHTEDLKCKTFGSQQPAMPSAVAEVECVFVDHVPDVQSFLYRGQAGNYSLDMIIDAYFHGIPSFQGTPLEEHMLSLVRVIVHHGHDKKPGAAQHLRDVAEAFMDCMAVQGRVVQRVAMEILGASANFSGLVTRIVGSQKEMALKMLAIEHVRQGLAADNRDNPTHYESRLMIDLGEHLGLNADDIHQARFDRQLGRFNRLMDDALENAVSRFRELFDISALLQTLTAELNSFSNEAKPDSFSRQFLAWVAANMNDPHVVFSAEDVSKVTVDEQFVLACLEYMFLGQVFAPAEEKYCGRSIAELFGPRTQVPARMQRGLCLRAAICILFGAALVGFC